MSQAAIETLRAGYRALSRGDWDEAFRLVHPEFELQTAGRVTSPGVYRGPEQARRFFEDLLEPFEEVIVEPLDGARGQAGSPRVVPEARGCHRSRRPAEVGDVAGKRGDRPA